MRRALRGVALLALVSAVAGCGGGGHAAATKLKIERADRSGVRAYRLTCDPAGGTAPHPVAICAELRREPKLLVGGPAFDHSCPSGAYESFRVSGSYRGYAIEATFPPSTCGWVPGQGDAADSWSQLLDDAGAGVAERELGTPRVTPAERKRNVANTALVLRTQRQDRRLARERRAAIEAGRLRITPRGRPDRVALAVLRYETFGGELLDQPHAFDARVYSSLRRTTEKSLGWQRDPTRADGPVYVLEVHYEYRDYKGRRHRDDQAASWSVFDARSLEYEGGGNGGSARLLGRPVTLTSRPQAQ